MAHAAHFLSRLARVSASHVDLALKLYRDPPLVRAVVQEARVPGESERVALALEGGEEGPYLVVTRDGAFVTCLGKGMVPDGLPVISRKALDGLGSKISALREKLLLAGRLQESGEAARLWGRLGAAGPWLSREEHRLLAAMTPLYGDVLFDLLFDFHEGAWRAAKRLMREEHLHKRDEGLLEPWWQIVWSLGHLSLLVAPYSRELLANRAQRGEVALQLFALLNAEWGRTALVLRGVWASAVQGKMVLASFKHSWEGKPLLPHLTTSVGLVLLSMALRHGKLHAEIRKLFGRGPLRVDGEVDARVRATQLHIQGVGVLDHPERALAEVVPLAQERLFAQVRAAGHTPPWTEPREIPAELALSAAAALPVGAAVNDLEELAFAAGLVPWLAHAKSEDFYLPADVLRLVERPWRREDSAQLADEMRELMGELYEPEVAEEKPGRNDPCSCKSGKKYKRCCGA